MYGAGDGIRTRDIDLGKVALYQLSYSRPLGNSIFLRNTGGVKRSEQMSENKQVINLQIGAFRVLDYRSVAMATGPHNLWNSC